MFVKLILFANSCQFQRDVGVDSKTVAQYYSILEDTLLGFFLEPFHTSIRKRIGQKPKFYLFDTGVQRSLCDELLVPLKESTSQFGCLFENFIVNECRKLSAYFENDYRFSYLITKDNVEIDLIVERPGQQLLAIEIKSATEIKDEHLYSLQTLFKLWARSLKTLKEFVLPEFLKRKRETAFLFYLGWKV